MLCGLWAGTTLSGRAVGAVSQRRWESPHVGSLKPSAAGFAYCVYANLFLVGEALLVGGIQKSAVCRAAANMAARWRDRAERHLSDSLLAGSILHTARCSQITTIIRARFRLHLVRLPHSLSIISDGGLTRHRSRRCDNAISDIAETPFLLRFLLFSTGCKLC